MAAEERTEIRGLVVVITGASSGIGAALAAHLAARGARLALIARRSEALEAVATACGPEAMPIVADVTSREAVSRAVSAVIERFGHIDVWVNNAGQGITRVPSELTDDDIDTMMRVNVKSALYGMQEVLPHFKARGRGQIVNISSELGRVPIFVPRSAYSASKHFLNALTANFRAEVRASHPGIQVSLVSPGVVATEFGLHAMHGGVDSRTLPGGQTPEEAAAAIAGAIETREADVYTRPQGRDFMRKYFASDEPGAALSR